MAKDKFEEMMDRLPSNIKETDVLRLSSKKVLAALLELLLHSEAKGSGVIYCQNARLRKFSGISSNDLLPSIEQLIDYNLISRKVGTVRKEGEKGIASEYIINFKKLKEPIVEKSFDDLFSEFLKDDESLEMPINTAITTIISNSISTSNIISSSTSIETSIINSTENINSLQEQNQEELETSSSEIDLDNNLSNKESLNNSIDNNILEETESNQELETNESESSNFTESQLETIDSEENNLSESQLVSNESEDSKLNQSQHDSIEIPTEVLISTNELESFNEEADTDESNSIEELPVMDESYVPTTEEKEIWKGCLTIMNPYLAKMQTVTSRMVVDGIKDEIVSKAINYFNSIDGVTDWVRWEFSKRVTDYTHARYDELEELNKKQREKQLQQSSKFAAFC
jgi:hypothetical protein